MQCKEFYDFDYYIIYYFFCQVFFEKNNYRIWIQYLRYEPQNKKNISTFPTKRVQRHAAAVPEKYRRQPHFLILNLFSKQLLGRGKLYAYAEKLHCLAEVFNGRIGR